MRTRAERLSIDGPSGALEVLREEPVEQARIARFGVVCHPHPLYGGTLDNKVAHTLAHAVLELGIPALRFNFRGVGASAGHFDDGRGEVDDALAVLEWGSAHWPQAVPWLLGFSFGAVVAIRARTWRPLSLRVLRMPRPPIRAKIFRSARRANHL